MKKGSFQYHLEALYGTPDRALRLNPFLHKVDTSRGKRPNAVITGDGNLMFVDRSGRLFRPSLIG